MTYLPRLASLIFNQAHLITESAADAVLAALNGRIGDIEDLAHPQFNSFTGEHVFDDRTGRSKGYRITKGGAAIVPIIGELVNRGAWLGASSGLVSYEGLRETLRLAASDPRTRSIVLDVDSPGGMAAGAFETAALVHQIAGTKPVVAVANSRMASAAYLISSGATKIVATDTGMVGSIGVLYVHADRSGEMAKRGVKMTIIKSGARKDDGNPFQPLPDDVRGRIQASNDRMYEAFVSAVVNGRSGLTAQQVRQTEAEVFMGDEAVNIGLADEVGTFDGAVAEAEAGKVQPRSQAASRSPAQSQPQQQRTAAKMNLHQGEPTAEAPGWHGMTLAEFNQAMEAMSKGFASLSGPAHDQGQQSAALPAVQPSPQPTAPVQTPQQPVETAQAAHVRGRSEERERVKAILTHPEAQGRQATAQVLALGSDLSVDAAASMLAQMPKEAGGKGAAFYAAVASQGGDPKVKHTGVDTPQAEKPTASATMVASMDRLIAQNHRPKQSAA